MLGAALSVPAAGAAEPLPVFDTHVHYSRDAWEAYPPAAVLRKMDAAGVVRALVSSTPDDGTLALYRLDRRRIVPVLRPYTDKFSLYSWYDHAQVPAYLSERLARGVYAGIGEFHLFYEVDTPTMRRVAGLALERDIYLHVHGDAAHVEALFAMAPGLKVLWAHAGLETGPQEVGRLLDRHPRLSADLSFRAADIAPDGRLDAGWRALLVRHADRFTVGTDTYVNGRWEAYRALVEEHRRWLARLPRDVAAAIAWGNAARLFGPGAGSGLRQPAGGK